MLIMKHWYLQTLFAFLLLVTWSCNEEDKDTTKPWIILKGPSTVYTPLNEPYIDSGAYAYDLGKYGDTLDISDRLQVTDNVNTSEIGKYWVKYNVEDEAGNKADEVTRTVYVQIFK